MPTYSANPFATLPEKLIPGIPAYLYGSWPKDTAPTKFIITNSALTTNVATITVLINEGNIPVVGALITVQGSGSGIFNVTNIAITAVSITASTGAGTISYALTHANVTSAADSGYGQVPQPEVGDTVANGFSVPVGLPYAVPWDAGQGAEALECEVNFPTLPTAAVVALQVAMTNTSTTQWQTAIANVVTVAASAATYGTTQWSGKALFARYAITGTSGSGTIVAKLAS